MPRTADLILQSPHGLRLTDTIDSSHRPVSLHDQMQTLSHFAREQLASRWAATHAADTKAKPKRVYYLSMEFLMGRSLSNALDALNLTGPAAQALQAHAHTLEDAMEHEPDAALGNGGLGRLAACFLDSMATLGLPSFGYGLRYEFEIGRAHV